MQITFNGITGNDEVYMDVLKAICGSTEGKSMLDAMCNLAPHTPLLGFAERKYVDILPRILDHKEEQEFFEQENVFVYTYRCLNTKRHDTVICSDGIEHIKKSEGFALLKQFEAFSDKQIIFTPLGNHMVEDSDNPEAHHSGWYPEDVSDYASIVFPNYHPSLGVGAFFFFKCDNLEQEFKRVHDELKTKTWYGLHDVKVVGNKKLAGTFFIRNGIKLDYCFEASLKSLQSFCDHVFVVYVESEDETLNVLKENLDDKTSILTCTNEDWEKHKGKEKLSIFQNVGIEYAEKEGYEYIFLCQADEVVHEDSIPFINQALALNEEGYFVSRHNLWGSSKTMLNVPQNRKPVSTVVNRLAKSCYRTVDDGESFATNAASLDFINLIEIYHCGFIRDSKKHVEKIKEIQGSIFQMDVDHRVKDAETFDTWGMGFTEKDVIPIKEELPVYVKSWAEERDKINNFKI